MSSKDWAARRRAAEQILRIAAEAGFSPEENARVMAEMRKRIDASKAVTAEALAAA